MGFRWISHKVQVHFLILIKIYKDAACVSPLW